MAAHLVLCCIVYVSDKVIKVEEVASFAKRTPRFFIYLGICINVIFRAKLAVKSQSQILEFRQGGIQIYCKLVKKDKWGFAKLTFTLIIVYNSVTVLF